MSFNTKIEFIKEIVANIELHYTVQEILITECSYFEIQVIENEEFDYDTVEKLSDFSYIENIDKDTEKFLGHIIKDKK